MTFTLEEDSEKQRILSFLASVDNEFEPSLHCRVDLKSYATKLSRGAVNLFLIVEDKDIAHAAFYCNDLKLKVAFISSIAVAPAFQGTGAAEYLLAKVMEKCMVRKMCTVRLEVNEKDKRAVRFYRNYGFTFVSSNVMQKDVCSKLILDG